jgi:hypothetical protein
MIAPVEWCCEGDAWEMIKRHIASSYTDDIQAAAAAAEAAGVRVRRPGLLLASEVDYHTDDLRRFLEGRKPAGRPPEWPWAECEAAMEESMLPATQAELVRAMADWFIGERGDHPNLRKIREKAKPLFGRLRGQN